MHVFFHERYARGLNIIVRLISTDKVQMVRSILICIIIPCYDYYHGSFPHVAVGDACNSVATLGFKLISWLVPDASSLARPNEVQLMVSFSSGLIKSGYLLSVFLYVCRRWYMYPLNVN